MSYEFPESWSLEQMMDYTRERGATFQALATLPVARLQLLPEAERKEEFRRADCWRGLSELWLEYEVDLKGEMKRTEEGEREAQVKRGRVRAADLRWDGALAELSSAVQFASGNNPRNAPYKQLFGGTTVKEAKRFGANNAGLWGQVTARKAMDLNPSFTAQARRLELYSQLYSELGEERDLLRISDAETQVRRIRLLERLVELVAETERILLDFLPRTEAKKAVRLLLSPHSPRAKKPRAEKREPESEA